MKIEKDRVVLFHYSVAEQGGESLESSEGRGPLAILVGHGNIIPGLEKAMDGREAGDKFTAEVKAAEAYGEIQPNLTQRVPKKYFKDVKLVPGMQAVLPTNFGRQGPELRDRDRRGARGKRGRDPARPRARRGRSPALTAAVVIADPVGPPLRADFVLGPA